MEYATTWCIASDDMANYQAQRLDITKLAPTIYSDFSAVKLEDFHKIFFLIFLIFDPKHTLWVHVRTASVRLF